jgi:hypothetical protein
MLPITGMHLASVQQLLQHLQLFRRRHLIERRERLPRAIFSGSGVALTVMASWVMQFYLELLFCVCIRLPSGRRSFAT